MAFEYIGEHESIDFYGLIFDKGKPITVPSGRIAYEYKKHVGKGKKEIRRAMVVDKLRGHPDFVEVDEPCTEEPLETEARQSRRGRPRKPATFEA